MSIASRPIRPPMLTAPDSCRASVGLPRFVAFAIHLLIFGSMFSGLPGPAALGELSGEGSLIGILAVILSAALSGAVLDVRGLKSALVFLPFLVCVVLSYSFNASDIANAHFMGREGGEKFFTSAMVIIFYFIAFFALSCLANVYGVRAMLLSASNAAVWCGFLMIAEMAVEIVSWFIPSLREAWRETRGLWVAPGSSAPMFRLVGFAPEPSLAAITAMALLGLLGAEVVLRGGKGDWPRTRARAVWFLIFALCILELLLANARTFSIGACGAALAWCMANRHSKGLPASFRSAVIVLAPLAVQVILIWTVLRADPNTRSVSNITRSVGMITASQLWMQHPLFGLGLGQYGFHFRGVVPSWGLVSFEISRYFREDQYNLLTGLPPSFSMFTRVGAELGVVGLTAWLLPPFQAIRAALSRAGGPLTTVLVCALVAQLWTGTSFDSFRNTYYWFWLAIIGAWPQQRGT